MKTILVLLVLLTLQSIAFSQEQVLIPYRKGELWGLADENKKINVEPAYEYIGFLQEGLAKAKKENTGWGYIDGKGTVKIPFMYWAAASDFHHGIAHVQKLPKQSGYYINKKGEKTTDLTIDKHKNYSREHPAAFLRFVDSLKKVYDDVEYEYYRYENDPGFIKVKKGEKWGLFQYSKGLIIPIEYEDIGYRTNTAEYAHLSSYGNSSENNIPVKQSGNWGIYNMKQSKLIIPARYRSINNIVKINHKDYFEVEVAAWVRGYLREDGVEFFE